MALQPIIFIISGLMCNILLPVHVFGAAPRLTDSNGKGVNVTSTSPMRKHRQPINCQELVKATSSQNTSWTPVCDASTNTLQRVQTLKTGQKFCVDIYTTGVLVGPTAAAGDSISCTCATQAKMARLHGRSSLASRLANSSSSLSSSSSSSGADSTVYIPQCDKNTGQFISKQCDVASGQCWCVDQDGKQVGDKWAVKDMSQTASALPSASGQSGKAIGPANVCAVPRQ